MKKLLPIALISAALSLAGCSIGKITVPPGSLESWSHTAAYGPYTDHVVMENVEKEADGTFIIGHYEGWVSWLGWGPHDVIQGLHVDGKGLPVAPAAPVHPILVPVMPAGGGPVLTVPLANK